MDNSQNSHANKRLMIIWYSRTGASKALAEAAFAAASKHDDLQAHLVNAVEAQPDDMMAADGYIFICPENLAAIAGGMKEFFDRCYYPLLQHIEGRPYAALIAAGSDGENALKQLERIATGWRLKKVMENIIIRTDAQTKEAILAYKTLRQDQLDHATTIGSTLAAGLVMGIF
jgi:NAD(P)H-dependent FMN reductase